MNDTLYRGLFDDAALFPPGNAPMGQALPDHREHRASERARYVGPFLVAEGRVAELRAVLAREETDHGPLEVVVTVPGGADDVPAALDALNADPALNLVGMEVAAPPGTAADTAAALTKALPAGTVGYVEVARGESASADIAALAGTGANAKFRTGGLKPEAHPTEAELAALISAAVTAEVPFKCTAGLHHAIRHSTTEGFEQHGFLNVLMATHTLLVEGSETDAREILAERNGPALAARAKALGDVEQADVRTRFRSFGTCSITEPLEDLTVLGAL
ncbi:hypothetical protein [Nocardiopsis alkaliphila]|uniref:hypothetical protein n=1 Tax=Nocardiopsis alkaliphila TaxID=225762 RepID=UPI0003483305|nr:hypothetical protein [Nocardiopsis alkaliphila]